MKESRSRCDGLHIFKRATVVTNNSLRLRLLHIKPQHSRPALFFIHEVIKGEKCTHRPACAVLKRSYFCAVKTLTHVHAAAEVRSMPWSIAEEDQALAAPHCCSSIQFL